MIQFKSKSIRVIAGQDVIHFANVAITTETGVTIALPFEVFKELFDPDNDEAIEWYKKLDRKLHPLFPGDPEYGEPMSKDEPARFPSRLFGKKPSSS